ncbi:hypothetical protein WQ57_05525 [Mesobacillus campisalis]|uniref:Uncharacterized protein n=1 Tax=Mesobacillus campisalis TaxID=1408103 RepID=A0A0M2SYH0_9BACI|nr:hypothetical protein WQ57_05525 [Mesobacillus campisalis]
MLLNVLLSETIIQSELVCTPETIEELERGREFTNVYWPIMSKYRLPYNYLIVWLFCACYDGSNQVGRL